MDTMAQNQQSTLPSPEIWPPPPTGHTPEQSEEVSRLQMAAMIAAFIGGFYAVLVGLCVLGSLGIDVIERLVGVGPVYESVGHLIVHSCAVAAGILLLVVVLGVGALLSCRSEGGPSAAS